MATAEEKKAVTDEISNKVLAELEEKLGATGLLMMVDYNGESQGRVGRNWSNRDSAYAISHLFKDFSKSEQELLVATLISQTKR